MNAPAVAPRSRHHNSRIFRSLQHGEALIAAVYIASLVAVAVVAPLVLSGDPFAVDFDHVRQPPNEDHWLGTDKAGRDILVRLIYGARLSLSVALLSQLPVLFVGLAVGSAAGYFGGWLDTVAMRLVEVVYSFPTLLFLILLSVVFGRGFWQLVLALSFVSWAGLARLVRGQVLVLREEEFIVAARATGAPTGRILVRHILPNLAGPLLVFASAAIPGAIVAEAGLSLLGLGLLPPAPSWGLMLADGFAVVRTSPHIAVFPALILCTTTFAFYLLGDALRDIFDPKSPG